MQCNAMQCNAMQCNAMQCNAMQCNAMQCNAMQCNAIQYNTIQYNTIQYNTIQYNTSFKKNPKVRDKLGLAGHHLSPPIHFVFFLNMYNNKKYTKTHKIIIRVGAWPNHLLPCFFRFLIFFNFSKPLNLNSFIHSFIHLCFHKLSCALILKNFAVRPVINVYNNSDNYKLIHTIIHALFHSSTYPYILVDVYISRLICIFMITDIDDIYFFDQYSILAFIIRNFIQRNPRRFRIML